MIQVLRYNYIKPLLIFDGRHLDSKKNTEDLRKKIKTDNKTKAEELLQQGKVEESKKYFQRSIKITKKIIYLAIDVNSHP